MSRQGWMRVHPEAKPSWLETRAYNERWSALRVIYAGSVREYRDLAIHTARREWPGSARVQVFSGGSGIGRMIVDAEIPAEVVR